MPLPASMWLPHRGGRPLTIIIAMKASSIMVSAYLDLLWRVESDSKESGNKRKRSRRNTMVEKQLQKERRRRVLRSRNPVIDDMLQRDREAGNDAGNDLEGAFIDLKDSLVEG